MSVQIEKGKAVFASGETEKTITYASTFTKPVIKITPTENDTVFITEVNSNFFKINKSSGQAANIYYIVLEGSE